MAKASAMQLDFTNVKDGGGSFNKKHQAPGDYAGKVTKVEDAKSKKDGSKMWLFTIQVGTGVYAYYCKFEENQLWKIRNLFVAAGVNVPKKRLKVDPSKVVGKEIGVTLDDEEYEGRMQSTITAVFPPSELEGYSSDDDDDDEEDEEDEETSTDEEDDEEDDEEEEEPKPKKKKGKKGKKAVDDDELEALDIEEI